MSKLSVLMTVYNEADFIEYAIRSCLPCVDHLVVVEGAYQETIKLGASPRSTDKTREIIQFLGNQHIIECGPSPFGSEWSSDASKWKIDYIEANAKTDKDQRNIGLDRIKELNPDGWFMIIDGDEVYDPLAFKMIRSFIKTMEKNDKYAAYFKSLTFVNDPYHFTEQSFPRLFKITSACTFVNDNFLDWPDKNLKWGHPHVIKVPIQYYHYSFLKGQKRFLEKRDWWMNRGLGSNFDYGWNIDKNGKINDPNHDIYEYTGKHPDIMKDHLLWKKDA